MISATKPALALYQPDIPQNTGTLLRLGTCLGIEVHIIHPTGFAMSDKNLTRAGLDYLERAHMIEHDTFDEFCDWAARESRRLVLLSTKGATALSQAQFTTNDILVLGRESAGVPQSVHDQISIRHYIPMVAGERSLNVAVSAAMAIGEALRQTNSFPNQVEA